MYLPPFVCLGGLLMFLKKVGYQYSVPPAGERNLSKYIKKIISLLAGSVHFTE